MTSSTAYRGGGFLSPKRNCRFSFDDTTVSSISELSPCAPRFFLYSCHCRLYIRRIPSFRILTAALTSLSWCVPHSGQIHARIRRSFVSLFLYPHTLHNWLLAKKRPTFTSCFPRSSILYFKKFINIPSRYPKRICQSAVPATLLSYRDLLYRRNHMHLQSFATVCAKISALGCHFLMHSGNPDPLLSTVLEPFCIFESFRCSS